MGVKGAPSPSLALVSHAADPDCDLRGTGSGLSRARFRESCRTRHKLRSRPPRSRLKLKT